MGPKLLFDKSFLQSLSLDEAVLLDNFFTCIVCPIFYIETLSDLAKTPKSQRTPEQDVSILAAKFPEAHGTPCAMHTELCVHNLLGTPVPMYGPIPRSGGRKISGGGQVGVVFEESEEEKAFDRWQAHEFDTVDRTFGRQFRQQIDSLQLGEVARVIQSFGINPKTCTSLEQAAYVAKAFVEGRDRPTERLAGC